VARLHADECFPQAVVEALRLLGHDVLTAKDAGRSGLGIDDADVLAFATTQGRAVLTHNRRHFIRLHTLSPTHAGIIICTRDNDHPDVLAARIHQAILNEQPLDQKLVRVYRSNTP
jgi:Domain of unknown function (DUF5615)